MAPATKQGVLLVDADEGVLGALARALDGRYQVLLARDGQEAIELLQSGSEVDAVVADASPPDASAQMLGRWLAGHRPALAERIVAMVAAQPIAEQDWPALHKPISRQALLAALARVLARPDVTNE